MARYELELEDDTVLHADDARFVGGGRFVEVIPRKAGTVAGGPERIVFAARQVRCIHHRSIGFSGGWRFTGEKDGDFGPSEGSI